jgi:hypothetical protein
MDSDTLRITFPEWRIGKNIAKKDLQYSRFSTAQAVNGHFGIEQNKFQ